MTAAILRSLDRAATDLARARAAMATATTRARAAAAQAHAAGVTDTEIARRLHVDRARTVRRWLGKE